MKRHVVLVGLPGAGKSTVARLAAAALGAPCADLDEQIASLAGKSISRIFGEDGEAAFRTLEKTLGEEALRGPPAVIATGGGYMEDPDRRRAALAGGLVIYLETTPAVAARRVGRGGGRPLLEGLETEVRLRELMARRELGYRQAAHTVTTDALGPEAVADQVVKLARDEGGW